MTEADHIAAVRAAPDDDAPRLAYADWLQKRRGKDDRARGAHIRAAVEAARVDKAAPGGTDLHQRAQAAWMAAAEAWRKHLGPDLHHSQFTRGLPEYCEIDVRTFLRDGERLFRLAPLMHVQLRDVQAVSFEEVLASPLLAQVTMLFLDDNRLGPTEATLLARSPVLAGLTGLCLSRNKFGDAGARALARSPHVSKFTALMLDSNGVGDDGASGLATSPHLRNLETLDLNWNGVGDVGARALAASANFVRLRVLGLFQNHVGDAGALALCSSPNLPSLAELNLNENHVSAAGRAAAEAVRRLDNLSMYSQRPRPGPEDEEETGERDEGSGEMVRAAPEEPPPARAAVATLTHTDAVRAVAFIPGGGLVSAGFDGVRQWGPDGAAVRSWYVPGLALSLAVSPDNAIACGSSGGAIFLWDAATGAARGRLTTEAGMVNGLAFSADEAVLATADQLGSVTLFRLSDGQRSRFAGLGCRIWAVSFSADGRVAAATDDGRLRRWQAASGEEGDEIHAHNRGSRWHGDDVDDDRASAVLFRPGGGLVSCGFDRMVRFWDERTGRETMRLRAPARALALALSPDGRLVAVGDVRGRVRLWEIASGQAIADLSGHAGPVHSIVFAPDGRRVATAGADGTARLWDVADLARPVEAATAAPARQVAAGNEGTTMTEAEWLAARDARTLLGFLPLADDGRKEALFGLACVRRVLHLLTDVRSRRVVEAVEASDGALAERQRTALSRQADAAAHEASNACSALPDGPGRRAAQARHEAARAAAALMSGGAEAAHVACFARCVEGANRDAEIAAQLSLLRDIVGNPFRRVRLESTWLTDNQGAAAQVAQAVGRSGDFASLPALADALEDAGCTDGELLGHLRSPGPHVKGCWAVDLLLGHGKPEVRLLADEAPDDEAALAEGARLMQAVLAAPDDDGPRLAYADWAERRGRTERASVIRWQVEAARLPPGDERRERLEERAAEVLRRRTRDEGRSGRRITYADLWREGVPTWYAEPSFVRGFPGELCFYGDDGGVNDFLDDAGAIWRLAPIEKLDFAFASGWGLARSRSVAGRLPAEARHVRSLDCHEAPGHLPTTLLASPYLSGVTHLHAGGCVFGDADLVTLLETATGRLKFLDLTSERHWEYMASALTPAGVAALAASERMAGLEDLRLSVSHVGDEGVRAIVGSPHLTRLRVLHLYDCYLTNSAAQALAAWPNARSLEWLEVSFNANIFAPTPPRGVRFERNSDAALRALAGSPHLAGLRTLVVGFNEASQGALEALVTSRHLDGLNRLELRHQWTDGESERLEALLAPQFRGQLVLGDPLEGIIED